MKKYTILLLAAMLFCVLVIPAQAAETSDSVPAMIAALPTVEEFKTMSADAQLEAYNRTQAAYDAYLALSEEEQARIPEADAVFDALFSHFNAQVMPIGEAAPAQTLPEAPAQKQTGKRSFNGYAWAIIAALAVTVPLLSKKR